MDEFELFADEFTEADQEDLVGFSCGESMSGRLCTEWISGSGQNIEQNYGLRVMKHRLAE